MTTYEVSMVFTWAALIGMVVKYFVDTSKFSRKLRRISSMDKRLAKAETDIASSNTGMTKSISDLRESHGKAFQELLAKSSMGFIDFSSKVTKDFSEMDSHLRDKLLEYGTQIAGLSYNIRELEEKYQLNAVELQEVEDSLEELKDVFGVYYEFLTSFIDEFGLDNSKVYQEIMARTKAIYELVEEVIGRFHGGKNDKNGVRTVATIGNSTKG